MLLTIFLLGLVYAVLIGVLFAAGAGAVLIAVVAAGLFLVQFFASDKIALASMGAHVVSPQAGSRIPCADRAAVHSGEPSQAARARSPHTPMPNAFAIGRTPKHATVCATTGILSLLSPTELEAVMAHELTHVPEPRRDGDERSRASSPSIASVHRSDGLLVRRLGWRR